MNLDISLHNEDGEEFVIPKKNKSFLAIEKLLENLLDDVIFEIYCSQKRYKKNEWQTISATNLKNLFQREMKVRGLIKSYKIDRKEYHGESKGISVSLVISNRSLTKRFGVTEPSGVELVHNLREELDS